MNIGHPEKILEILLKTLSFSEALSKEQVILDMDSSELLLEKKLSLSDLEVGLEKLWRNGEVEKSTIEGDVRWRKLLPAEKRRLSNKLKRWIRSFTMWR